MPCAQHFPLTETTWGFISVILSCPILCDCALSSVDTKMNKTHQGSHSLVGETQGTDGGNPR